jgi:hypothetical protein
LGSGVPVGVIARLRLLGVFEKALPPWGTRLASNTEISTNRSLLVE